MRSASRLAVLSLLRILPKKNFFTRIKTIITVVNCRAGLPRFVETDLNGTRDPLAKRHVRAGREINLDNGYGNGGQNCNLDAVRINSI